MKKDFDGLIISVLITSSAFSLILSFFTDYIANSQFYIGSAGIIVSLFLRLRAIKISKYLLGSLLLLGTFQLVKFSHIDFGFSFSFSGFKILGFNPIILVLLFLYFISNRELIHKLLGEGKEITEEERKEIEEHEISRFIKHYSDKSQNELEEIITNPNSFVSGAVKAAERLIQERKNVL